MTGGEIGLYNGNMRIIEKGYRDKKPIALVEKTIGNEKGIYCCFLLHNKTRLNWNGLMDIIMIMINQKHLMILKRSFLVVILLILLMKERIDEYGSKNK